MNTIEAISGRRSIRKFKSTLIPNETIEKVLNVAIQAPSAKNSQPWYFIVVGQNKKSEMIKIMRKVIDKLKKQGCDIGSSEQTTNSMEQAPVNIFVFNTKGKYNTDNRTLSNIVDIQSIGAAIQNMILAAHELGIGTLWICDVFYAYDELCTWLAQEYEMIAAVSLGYPDEKPWARPRMPLKDIMQWL
jgi:nitroreductase